MNTLTITFRHFQYTFTFATEKQAQSATKDYNTDTAAFGGVKGLINNLLHGYWSEHYGVTSCTKYNTRKNTTEVVLTNKQ